MGGGERERERDRSIRVICCKLLDKTYVLLMCC
jgi:hypothetical protein